MSESSLQTQIETLELKAAYQEHHIEQLSQALAEQQNLINKLQVQMKYLHDRLQQSSTSNVASMSEETPPPHY